MEEVYTIKNKNGLYATYGRSEFKKGLRFARLYKSKETALRHYFSNCGQYEDLSLVKIQIKILGEEMLFPYQFKENQIMRKED
jgi:hypothetical protein